MRGNRLRLSVLATERRRATRWAWVLLTPSLFLGSVPRADDAGAISKTGPATSVDIVAELVSQRYCGWSPDDDVVSLVLTLKVQARNASGEPIILTRNPTGGPPLIAASVENGDKGVFEIEWVSWSRYGDEEQQPSFGESPDPEQFIVVEPNESYATRIETFVLVRRRTTKPEPNMIVEGSEHVLQLPTEWWAPFFSMTNAEVAELKRRWKGKGQLVVGVSRANWIGFSAPRIERVALCQAQQAEK